MCVIIHKPAGVRVPATLLLAATSLNRDGWGLMGLDACGELILHRSSRVDADELIAAAETYEQAEVVFHLRLLTSGSTHWENIHPLWVGGGSFLMHNGTLSSLQTPVQGRSDSWHFARQVLRPLLQQNPGLIATPAFKALVELALGTTNRAVLLDQPSRSIHIFNRHLGIERHGLWISNPRWIDERVLSFGARHRQETSLRTERLRFI